MSLLERLETDGPKRILSLDGGGIRGIISIGFLERIESQLRERIAGPAALRLLRSDRRNQHRSDNRRLHSSGHGHRYYQESLSRDR